MPRIHVSPLSQLHSIVAQTGARHVVTLINVATVVTRPPDIHADDHLFIGVSDITAPMDGHILPGAEHVERLLTFVRRWDATHLRRDPIVIHCWAGVSRSTAAAFITACALAPGASEASTAARLRAASAKATPNEKLVAAADDILGRGGRMVDAVRAIGRGADAYENDPFILEIG